MRLLILAVLVAVVLPSAAAAVGVGTPPATNVSGPSFLQGIGPREPRTDNRAAAGFTAIVVAAVILRGLHVDQDGQSAAK